MDLQLRCMAAYEWAMALPEKAGTPGFPEALCFVYTYTDDISLFWKAGYILGIYSGKNGSFLEDHPDLARSLATCAAACPVRIRKECLPILEGEHYGIASLPARWITAFYRSQISPAIGARCDLAPSCSEYFMQSSMKHGLLGLPMIADRLCREPSVPRSHHTLACTPDGRIRYNDPVTDHDFWMKGNDHR